jgi:hypothetical protein
LCNVIADKEDILSLSTEQLACLLQEELNCYKVITRYDTSIEQLSVTKQLIELYSLEEDTFNLATVMLEHARALHSSGNPDYSTDKYDYIPFYILFRFFITLTCLLAEVPMLD